MNITQSKRSKQPVPLYECGDPHCLVATVTNRGDVVAASELHWSGGDDHPWDWRCRDCIENESMERGQSLSAFMAEEHRPIETPSRVDPLLHRIFECSMEIVAKAEDMQDVEVECVCGASTRGHAVWVYADDWRRYLRCPLCHEELVPEGASDA